MSAHPHAASMLQYAQDAAETDKPWQRWEVKTPTSNSWTIIVGHPQWLKVCDYRRKPRTIKVNGFNVPEPLKEVKDGTTVWLVCCHHEEFADWYAYWQNDPWKHRALKRGLLHATKENAVAHAKAMLGIDPNEGE